MKLAEKIRMLRNGKKWSQKELGKKVGVDQKQICRYETGEYSPSINVLKKLAEVFGVTTDYLLDEEQGKGLDNIGIKDRELFVYCKTIDKMPEDTRKAIKLILKSVVMAGNIEDL